MIFAEFRIIGQEHVDGLIAGFVVGMTLFFKYYFPMVLGFSLITQQSRIGKTLTNWLRWIVMLHLRRLRRLSRDAESMTLFGLFTIKLRPALKPRTNKRNAAIRKDDSNDATSKEELSITPIPISTA